MVQHPSWLPALRRILNDELLEVRSIDWEEGFRPLERDLDVGIVPLPLATPLHLRWPSLAMTDVWAALPKGHALAGRARVPFNEISLEPLLLTPLDPLWRKDIDVLYQALGYALRLGPEFASMTDALAAVADERRTRGQREHRRGQPCQEPKSNHRSSFRPLEGRLACAASL